MEYPIFLVTEEEKIECTNACEQIEGFIKRKGEKLKYEEINAFVEGIKFSSEDVMKATLQEAYKELSLIGMCLNIYLEGSAQYEVSFIMAESMWIIMHVKYMTEFIRNKGEQELLDYVATWLKIITEQQTMNFGDVEKYI